MPDYQNGKIYKVIAKDCSDELGDMYIGSTCLPLSSRMSDHRINARKGKNSKVYVWLRNIGVENAQIILVENYACNDKEQLRQREQYWKEQLQPSLNTNDAYVSIENRHEKNRQYNEQKKEQRRQYYEQKKEQIAEQKRQYRERNKEQIAEQKRKNYQLNKEQLAQYQRQYREQNKEQIAEQKRKNYQLNKEQIAEQKRQYREQNKEHIAEYQRQYRERKHLERIEARSNSVVMVCEKKS